MKQTELNKALQVAAKAEAKARRWKFVRSTPYWTQGPLFFSLTLAGGANEQTFYAWLRFKWLDLDHMLWRVLGMSSNEHEPFSLHAIGAFVLTGWEIHAAISQGVQWDEPESLEQQVRLSSQKAASRAQEVALAVESLDSYVSFLQRDYELFMLRHPKAAVTIWKELLLVNLLRGDKAAAAEIARSRIAARDTGNFMSGGKSFYERALILTEQ